MLMTRLTNEWTATLEGAYGEIGKEARNAELFVKEAIESWGWLVKDNESDYNDQVSGKDLLIKNPSWKNFYSVDVKNNMNDYGCFFVDSSLNGWLFKKTKTSDRIWHVNTKMYVWELMDGRYSPMPDVTAFPNEGPDRFEGML